jgi:hypothetical protein
MWTNGEATINNNGQKLINRFLYFQQSENNEHIYQAQKYSETYLVN